MSVAPSSAAGSGCPMTRASHRARSRWRRWKAGRASDQQRRSRRWSRSRWQRSLPRSRRSRARPMTRAHDAPLHPAHHPTKSTLRHQSRNSWPDAQGRTLFCPERGAQTHVLPFPPARASPSGSLRPLGPPFSASHCQSLPAGQRHTAHNRCGKTLAFHVV